MTPAEEAAAKEASESKGVVKFGWIKGVLVSNPRETVLIFCDKFLMNTVTGEIHFSLKCGTERNVLCHVQ